MLAGLDISDTILRLVLLDHGRRGWRLPVRAELPLLAGVVTDGTIQQPEQLSQLIRQLVTATGVKVRRLTVSIPERHSFVKLLALPAGGSGTVAEQVQTTLGQDLPYAIAEVYWDWHDLHRKNSLGEELVLAGAAPKTIVDSYLQALAGAAIEAERVEIESLAIARAMFGWQTPDDTRLILDLGRTRSNLILLDHGIVQFTSTIRYAGRELNQYIMDELRLTEEQAEKAKSLFGLDQKRGKGLLRTILLPHIEAVVDTLGQVERFYTEHFVDHQPLSTIFLTGSGALLRGIDTELAGRIQQSVVVQPSWMYQQLLRVDPQLPTELGYTFSTAFGLAMNPLQPRP